MPRFDNEGFNPSKRIDNDNRDRSVPDEENYYGKDFDLFGNEPSGTPVIDKQDEFVPLEAFPVRARRLDDYNYEPPEADPELVEERRRRAQQRSEKKKAQEKRKKKNKKRARGIIAVILILLIVLIPAFLIEGILGKIHYDNKKPNQYVASTELKSDDGIKNILLLGVDARKGQKASLSHPDSIMLVSVDMKHKCIKMTSFLRDTWVYIPSRDVNQRINTGTNPDGYSGMVDTIESNFGVDIDGYVVTNFRMFRKMVNSIGGVVIDVTKEEAEEVTSHPYRYGHVKLKAGKHRLTGKQALAYARIRKIDTDFVRAKRQRTVVNSIINEAKKNPLKLYNLANASAPYVRTDLTKSELKKIMAMAMLCMQSEMPQDKVPFEGTWEYAYINGAAVISIDIPKNKEILIDNIYNKTAEELLKEEQ